MPDLAAAISRGRTLIGSVLIDKGTITRDSDGLDDAGYDPTTMRASVPTDSTTVWSGDCMVIDAGNPEQPLAPGTPIAVGTYRVFLPYNVPEIRRGDVLTLTKSQDPRLLAKPLFVHSAGESTVNVARVLNVSTEPPR